MRLAIWAETQPEARKAAESLGLDPKAILALGNRSELAVRGRELDVVLILPGADSELLARSLPPALLAQGGTIIDLRRVSR